ncbi:hypothetical protein V502_02013 [Pseudogymnoascus sp. VKM F-4520 (FW-2644)]|nr:hypothetical protein V502_02013 [Pseudogymnoascus sp. VKM F-4520 (FW-2644)]
MDKRPLREQFRKRKNSLFQRAHETSAVCEANILIVVEKNNRLHVYGTMDDPAKLLCKEYKAKKEITVKRPGELKTTSRMEMAACRRNNASNPPPSPPSSPPISIPAAPKLNLDPHRGLAGLKGSFVDFVTHIQLSNHN